MTTESEGTGGPSRGMTPLEELLAQPNKCLACGKDVPPPKKVCDNVCRARHAGRKVLFKPEALYRRRK